MVWAALLLVTMTVTAQTDDEKAAKVKEIMLDESYIVAESNGDDEQTTYDIALSELLFNVNAVRSQHGKQLIDNADDLKAEVETIVMMCGERHRVVVYIAADKALMIVPTP